METMTVNGTAEATGSTGADPPRKFAEPKSPRVKPPPLDGSDLKKVATGVPETGAPNVSYESSHGAYGSPDPPTSLKNRYSKENPFYPTFKSSSFSHPSPANPPHPQLSYSVSSPILPSFPEGTVESAQGGKYRPRTRSPSDGADVRWYFCKTPLGPNEKAASVPLLEVVGKGEYFRFSVSDSSTLEAAFLEREEELVSAWWKEYADCGEGPSNAISASSNADSREIRVSSEVKKEDKDSFSDRNRYRSSRGFESSYDEDESVGVIVKGGLYEVDLRQRRCSPVYWRGDHRRVLRGHWFALKGGLDWLPLREDIAEQLEIAYESKLFSEMRVSEHCTYPKLQYCIDPLYFCREYLEALQIWRRRRFQPSGLFAARVNLHGATEGLHALFTGEDDSWEAWLCVDASGISFVLGLKSSGVKLRRGFVLPESAQPTQDEIRQRKEEEMDDYASKVPVRHVVFMVHGIGQRLEKANLVDDVGTFRHTVAMLAEHHLTQYQRNAQRVLFIPCQWRRGLKLGGESAVEDCTLEGVRALRTMLSATVHDVLYYMSPVYCQDIIDSVSHSLNKLYGKFIKRNPNYDGKVSIYGHSLGSVLSYDILCHQRELTSVFPIMDVRPGMNEKVEDVSEGSDGFISEEDDSFPEESSGPQENSSKIQEKIGDKVDVSPASDGGTDENGESPEETSELEVDGTRIEEKSGDGVEGFPASDGVRSENVKSFSVGVSRHDDSRKVENSGEIVSRSDEAKSENGEVSLEDISEGPAGNSEDRDITGDIDGLHHSAEQDGLPISGDQGPIENVLQDHELRGDGNVDASSKYPSEASGAEETEITALREEVRTLREKLAALTAEQTYVNELTLLPTAHAVSGITSPGLGSSERSDTEGEETSVDNGPGPQETNDYSDGVEFSRVSPEANDLSHRAGPSRMETKASSKKHFTPYISYTKLDFKVDTFYAVGSPLGVFLSLRNIRLGIGEGHDYWNDESIEEEMPDVRQMMNIFHPYDPVAYRIEPLVCKEFVEKRPTFIPYHRGGKRLHIGMQEFSEDLSARSRAIVDSLSLVGTRVASAFSSGAAEKKVEENPEGAKVEKTYGALMMERITGGPGGRMDYMLQDSTFEHQYISVISSHTSYWHDLDTALFILRHLYKDIPEQPPSVNVQPDRSDEATALGPITEEPGTPDPSSITGVNKMQDDSDSDDLSLTFSGKEGIAAILDDAKNVKPGFTV